MKHVIVSHTLHADEGVYRLVHGIQETRIEAVEIPNPDHHPDDQDSPATIWADREMTRVIHADDVIWDASDDRWHGMTNDAIAASQREELTKALAEQHQHTADLHRAREQAMTDLGGAGTEL